MTYLTKALIVALWALPVHLWGQHSGVITPEQWQSGRTIHIESPVQVWCKCWAVSLYVAPADLIEVESTENPFEQYISYPDDSWRVSFSSELQAHSLTQVYIAHPNGTVQHILVATENWECRPTASWPNDAPTSITITCIQIDSPKETHAPTR